MNRYDRLMTTLRGGTVDRPAVSFYEINGLDENPADPDPDNIFNDPSWRPLIELARERSDRIVMRSVPFTNAAPDPLEAGVTVERWDDASGSHFTRRTLHAPGRTLTSLSRRDPAVNTVWQVEHLLKDAEDLRALLELCADPAFADWAAAPGTPDLSAFLAAEAALGDTGIVLVDIADPLCEAAQLFDMAAYTVVAYTEPALFHRLLQHFAVRLQARTELVARLLPGRLWRIYGPEYASPPYLPPRCFHEYVVAYDTPLVTAIQRHGGYARIHCHGRLRQILDGIAQTGCTGLDPIEPPPQGDVSLAYVRERVGQQIALFGNLEASDIETLPTPRFREKIQRALDEGTSGPGRGFVLMPSACPYGRTITPLALANYQAMLDAVGA